MIKFKLDLKLSFCKDNFFNDNISILNKKVIIFPYLLDGFTPIGICDTNLMD